MGAGTVRSSSTILAASHGSRPRLTATKRDASQPCWALAVCPSHQNGPIRPSSGHGDRRLTSRARRSGRAGRLTAGLRGPRKKFSPSNSTPAYTLVALNRRSEQVEIFTLPDIFKDLIDREVWSKISCRRIRLPAVSAIPPDLACGLAVKKVVLIDRAVFSCSSTGQSSLKMGKKQSQRP